MIFGSPEGSKVIKDPSEGARIERVGEQEIVDIVESDFMEIGKIMDISGNREMESRESVEAPPISVSPDPIVVLDGREPMVPPIAIPIDSIAVDIPKPKSRNEKDQQFDINRYKFFDSKRKLKSSAVGGNCSSSNAGAVPVPVEKPAVPTMIEFARRDESELGK